MSILQRLYDSEIDVWVTSFWDDGFYVRLGDEMNVTDATAPPRGAMVRGVRL